MTTKGLTDEQAYEMWLREGANRVGLELTRKALNFAAAEPTAALRLDQLHAQAAREAEAVRLYEETSIMHGASAEDARRDALAHVRAERQERTDEALGDARRSAAARTREIF